jgi:DNA-binding transcriptional LysR family regulator
MVHSNAAQGEDVPITEPVNQQRPRNWRFDDILTFVSVVEAGSVTSAATRLNVSKSAISKRISDLEAALRVELFHRSTGNVKPTELAESFYERIVELIRGITEATEEVSQRTARLTGRLRVTAPISFGTNFLGPVIAEFARRHPELAIAVDYEDRLVNLTRAGYDLGIRIGGLKESSLKARKLCDCARIVCCSPDYAAEHGLPESVADLALHACIDYADIRTSDFWRFDTGGGGGGPVSVRMRSRIVANNFEAMRDMAIAGLGLVLLPEYLAAGPLQEGRLIPALSNATPRPDPISAVYPYTHHVSSKVRALIDHLVVALAPPLPWHRHLGATGNSTSQPDRAPETRQLAA